MTRRVSPKSLWGVFVAVSIAAGFLKIVYGPTGDDIGSVSIRISMLVAFGVFATVGAIILSRRPRHAIGWIYLLGALGAALGTLVSGLVDFDIAMAGRPPGFPFVWWLDAFLQSLPLVVLIPFPLLLFPHGTLRSPRWRVPFWIAVTCVTLIGARSFVPGRFDQPHAPANPLAIPRSKAILESMSINATGVLGLIGLAAIVSLFARFRRATGAERQQLKWLGWGGVWTIVLLFMSGPGTYGGILPMPVVRIVVPLVPYMFAMAFAVIPLFTAVAILRYRLYDIDRIVSRTVGYVLITGVLLGAYVGLVVLFQLATRPVTEGSDLAVAASTLIVAAAFRPVRRRIQRTIDHRFNRARYDAAEAIELFATRLRDEIDIDTLSVDLQTLVYHTMEPAHVSLWLRSGAS